MPKRKLDINVRNPFALKDAVSGPNKKKEVKSANLNAEADTSANPQLSSTYEEPNFNLFAGTELGVLKGISLGGELPLTKNIWRAEKEQKVKKPPEVVCLQWTDEAEKELLVTLSNHLVKTYSTKLKCFTRLMELEIEEEAKVTNLCCHDARNYVFGLDDGTVGMWNFVDAELSLSFKSGNDMRKIQQCPADKSVYATGGNENDLKVWNLSSETPSTPTFQAKNLPHDFLDLRVPVWIQDLTFLPRTTDLVAVGTRYGQIRLYDVRVENRRPVSNVQFVDHPIMSIAATINDRQVIVGTARGEAGLYDLRNPGKEKLCLKYFGHAGSIRSIVASPDKPYFATVGLDRHLYVHKFTDRHPLKKLYMKERLNCIALTKNFMADTSKGNSEGTGNSVSAHKDDWTNIPPDVLCINEPDKVSPQKKNRKSKLCN